MINIPGAASSSKASYDVIPVDAYPARFSRFVGLGVQAQRPYLGKEKKPAFKVSLAFELIGVKVTGTDAEGNPTEPRPAVVYATMFLHPGATRGHAFDFAKAIDSNLTETPKSFEWFVKNLGAPLMVNVQQYEKDGITKNAVGQFSKLPSAFASTLGPCETELLSFIPYADDEVNQAAYNKLFDYQRDMLTEAVDAKHIPFAGRAPVTAENTNTDDNDDVPY